MLTEDEAERLIQRAMTERPMRTFDVYKLPDPEQIGTVQAGSMMEALREARAKFPAVDREQLSIDEAEYAGEEPASTPDDSDGT